MHDLPTGTVTLLVTDIEGSTLLLQRLSIQYGDVLAEYRALLRTVFTTHGGQEVDTQGDSFFVAFSRALDAVHAAVEIQRAIAKHPWPEGVTMATRMGLHTGEPRRGGEGYVGLDVHRAARIGAAGHGGQVLLSDTVCALVVHDLPDGANLRDLGEHQLKDLQHAERIFQLVVDALPGDFPPLKTLDARTRDIKLCVCGRSQAYPICDDSHLAEGWTCASNLHWAPYGFCTSYRYQNLAKKLASHHQGLACLPGDPPPSVDTLVTIVDGTDLDYPLKAYRQIRAKDRVVVTLGVAGELLAELFPGSEVVDLRGQEPAQAFQRINALLRAADQPEAPPAARSGEALRSAFVSHAVHDEALLMPALDYARRYYHADLFACSDSIQPGTDWQRSIMAALEAKELFVLLLSAATLLSHFCSFEIGVAVGLNKPMAVISLDGSRPPRFVQQLQAIDIPRIERQKPWLERRDILLEVILRALEYTH